LNVPFTKGTMMGIKKKGKKPEKDKIARDARQKDGSSMSPAISRAIQSPPTGRTQKKKKQEGRKQ